jgi:hypothetical protein
MKYVPISVHMPDHVRQLRARQARNAATEGSWWFSENPPSKSRPKLSSGPRITSDDIDLTQELSAAMESPLSTNSARNTPYKTSETHPIKSDQFFFSHN